MQHCTARQFSLFLQLLQLGKTNICGIFSVTTTHLQFYWYDALWTVGDVCLSVGKQKLFSFHPLKKRKEGNGKIEKQSTPPMPNALPKVTNEQLDFARCCKH